MAINYFDIGVLVILIFGGIRGGLNGFIREVSGIIALIAGIFVAKTFYIDMAAKVAEYVPDPWAQPVSFAVIIIAVMLVIGIVARMLGRLLNFAYASSVDKLFGAAVGIAKAILICVLIAAALRFFFKDASFAKDSLTLPYLYQIFDKAFEYFNATPKTVV